MKRRGMTMGWLVGAAALLFAGCSSDDTISEETKTTEQPQTATIHVTVGAGISDGEGATRSTVVKDGGTRTLQFTTDDKLYVWGQKNIIYDQNYNSYYEYVVAGTLELDAIDSEDPTKATFSGDLSVYRAKVEGDYVGDVLYTLSGVTYPDLVSDLSGFLQSADPLGEFENVEATLIHEDAELDVDYVINEDERKVYYRPDCAATVEALMTTKLWVRGNYNSSTKSFALAKDTDQPIVNCTIAGLTDGMKYKVDYIYGTTAEMSDHTKALASALSPMTADDDGTLAFAFFAETGDKFHGIRLTNTADEYDVSEVSLGQKAFESKVYNVSRRFVDLGDASTYTDEGVGFIAQNGDILSGTKPTGKYVRIADGAKVTLHNATIENSNFHGFECYGSATINLEGANTVSGGGGHCGINCDGTLTIQGSGSLAATGGNGYAGIGGNGNNCHVVIKGGTIVAQGGTSSNYSGAGIGGGGGGNFGNIRIEGGTVTATGGANATGIGCGYYDRGTTCGTITITGGEVTAYGGGETAAGIGCGSRGTCGDITITGGNVTATGGERGAGIGSSEGNSSCGDISIANTVTSVKATSGGGYAQSIGAGARGMCGKITIGCTFDEDGDPVGGETYPDGIYESPFTYPEPQD